MRSALNPVAGNFETADGRWINLTMLQPGRYWADFCRHIDREDLIEDRTAESEGSYHFGYAAPQGEFELIVDRRRCELLDTESTVEQIATHAARLLKEREPGARFRVRAYEGVRKGAIADV